MVQGEDRIGGKLEEEGLADRSTFQECFKIEGRIWRRVTCVLLIGRRLHRMYAVSEILHMFKIPSLMKKKVRIQKDIV